VSDGQKSRRIKIVRDSSIPTYVQIAEQLKAHIQAGAFAQGSRLPTEAELIRQSKLSRITVRRGIELLEKEGWVVRKQGLGTFVRPTIKQELSTVRTITEVLLAKGIVPHVRVLSFGEARPPESVRLAMRLSKNENLLLIERLYSNKDEPVALLRTYLPLSLREQADVLRSEEVPVETTYTILERHVGVRLKDASYSIQATKADRDDAAFLGLDEGDPILLLDRVTFAEDGRPVECSIFHYHWERYEFSVTAPRIIPKSGFPSR
jgi:GntR family transcriptional regulator